MDELFSMTKDQKRDRAMGLLVELEERGWTLQGIADVTAIPARSLHNYYWGKDKAPTVDRLMQLRALRAHTRG